MKTKILSITLVLFLGAGIALAHHMAMLSLLLAHDRRLDRYGCRKDDKTESYHCQRGPCAGKIVASQAEMLKAGCWKS